MCLIYIYICIVVECKKVKMDKYELLFTHTINLLEMGCKVNFKYTFCDKRWQSYLITICKIVTFQQEIAWKLTKCLSLSSIRGGRYNGMVLSSLLFLFHTILLFPFDPNASWLYITQQGCIWILHLEGYDQTLLTLVPSRPC